MPDNYSRYELLESEIERLERIHKRQEIEDEIETEELPFYEEREG